MLQLRLQACQSYAAVKSPEKPPMTDAQSLRGSGNQTAATITHQSMGNTHHNKKSGCPLEAPAGSSALRACLSHPACTVLLCCFVFLRVHARVFLFYCRGVTLTPVCSSPAVPRPSEAWRQNLHEPALVPESAGWEAGSIRLIKRLAVATSLAGG